MDCSTNGIQGHHGVKGLGVAPTMSLLIFEDCYILWSELFDVLGMIRSLSRQCTFLEKVKDVAQIMLLCIVLNVAKQLILGQAGERVLPATKSVTVLRDTWV